MIEYVDIDKLTQGNPPLIKSSPPGAGAPLPVHRVCETDRHEGTSASPVTSGTGILPVF